MSKVEYSILRAGEEWKLLVDREIRGVFPNEEAATFAALAAVDAARKMGYRATTGTLRQQRRKEHLD